MTTEIPEDSAQTGRGDDGNVLPRQDAQNGAELPGSATRPVSFMALGMYNFAFILLTLHGPYTFLYMLPNLVMTPQGLDYDMGGIFPHVGAAMAIFGLQGSIAFIITVLVCFARLLYRRLNAFMASFLSICGLQLLVYYHIYFSGKTDPAVLQAFGPFSTSWLLLLIFVAGSLLKISRDRS